MQIFNFLYYNAAIWYSSGFVYLLVAVVEFAACSAPDDYDKIKSYWLFYISHP